MSPDRESAYARAGVDIDAQDKALGKIKKLVRSTFTDGVLSELGSFGGLFRPELAGMTEPVLVASADGVGTKLMIARQAGDFSTVGQDLVNHCVNDILVQGARPLFFMDYVGAGVLEPQEVVDLVSGVASACRENGCALLGGEMAEMPGFYEAGDYELVGFILGLVDRPAILDGSRVRPRDLLIGLPSSGLHTNGYSLVRKIVFDDLGLSVGDRFPGSEIKDRVGKVLLSTHRAYLPAVGPLLGSPGLHAWRISRGAASPTTCRGYCQRSAGPRSGSAPGGFQRSSTFCRNTAEFPMRRCSGSSTWEWGWSWSSIRSLRPRFWRPYAMSGKGHFRWGPCRRVDLGWCMTWGAS